MKPGAFTRPGLFVALVLGVTLPFLFSQSREERQKQFEEATQWNILRPVVRGQRAAVGAGTPLVTEASMRVLHAGGNAVDAGVASLFAGGVSEFSHFGFGGEAPILIRTPEGKVVSIAGVGTAPQLMTREFFAARQAAAGDSEEAQRRGKEEGPIPAYGILPTLVPSMVDAGLLALKEYGTRSFEETIQPALELADGFPIDNQRAQSIAQAGRFLQVFPTSLAVYAPEGRMPRPGDIFRQADLAKTLRAMIRAERSALAAGKNRELAIDAVRDYFYRGEIAREIGDFVKKNNGLLRYEDMASFRLEVEEPLMTTFQDYEVYKGSFWGQGPMMLQALNILEGYPLQQYGWNSPEYIHYVTEALKLAYADRDTWYADPKFFDVPKELLTKQYAAERRKLISGAESSKEFRPGQFFGRTPPHPSRYDENWRPLTDALASHDTTALAVVDKDGWMFSATPSGAWMPSVIAGSTGIPLGQRAQSFFMIEDHPNVIAPGKRPRVTLTPTIVTRNGQPYMALNTPGGDQQDQALLQVLLDSMLFGFNAEIAVEAPRIQTRHLVASFDNHAMDPNLLLLDERIPESVLQRLLDLGHDVERRSRWDSGSAPVAVKVLENGVIEAGADPYGYRYADAW
jgi:gamma-glutamyltranspeptidase/glutathione hydrolase